MKKYSLIIITILSLLIPMNIYAADGDTARMYINIDILDNGDIKVSELASLEGTYNGRLREIRFRNIKTTKFTGDKKNFEGSSIYNGDAIEDLKIYGVHDRSSINFDTIKNETRRTEEFKEVITAYNGDKGVYEKDDRYDGMNLKIFNPSSTNEAFLIEYTVKNVVVVHKDVAEIAWMLIGNNFEDNIGKLEARINLPGKDSDVRVFLHGPYDGNIERVDGKYAKITYANGVGRKNFVSTRLMFNKNLVPNATKTSSVAGKKKNTRSREKMGR